jgi:hypothetical protein
MAEKIGVATQNRQADSLGSTFYGGGNLKIYSGSQPSTADTSPTGTLLVTITLPATPFAAASSGVIAKSGTWSGVAGAGSPTNAGWFRIQTSGNTHPLDGAITATGGGGELELDNIAITSGQTVTINSFTITQPSS